MLTTRSSTDDVRKTYVPVDDVQMMYTPVDDVWMMYLPADDMQTMFRMTYVHPPAKSPMKSHSCVIRTSSARHLHIVRTSSARRLHKTSVPRQFPVKEQRQLC